MSETIINECHGSWHEITLNRPEKLNSFNEEMHLALREALNNCAADNARAVLITGSGKGFCAGQDLSNRDPRNRREPMDLSLTLNQFYNPLVQQIRSLNAPVICAVNGVAAGAGANIALACDLVMAADSAKFIQSFAKVGLVPDSGGTWSLTQLIGEARAKALALTAEPLSAKSAVDWGLIWKVLSAEELMIEARALAMRLSEAPTFGLAQTKHAIQCSHQNSFSEQLELEATLQKQCGQSPDYSEGVSAFLENREPTFTGKPS